MINDNVIETDNYWTEGFNVTISSPMTLAVTEGKFYVQSTVFGEEVGQVIDDIDSDDYPAFTFDVTADTEFDVIYDVYLIDLPSNSGNSIHVDRTEVGGTQAPFYEGNDVLRFLLMSFLVPPNTSDLNNINITVNKAVKK